jgi:hypothetical protein
MKATILFAQMPAYSFDAVWIIYLIFFAQYFQFFLRFRSHENLRPNSYNLVAHSKIVKEGKQSEGWLNNQVGKRV